VIEIVARIFWVNLALVALAIASAVSSSTLVSVASLVCGAGLVLSLLVTFQGKRR